ncbi:Tannase/feruloyl esterase [Phaeosphaeria sp. MPI-PUGE-AT-0046c]|nr:Tannase/feruloyl esterase [Phaeosphaeria sp. MPI-PUGE-AT-0046c]
MFGAHLGAAVKSGWAAVSTDGGHNADLDRLTDASWILSGSGETGLNNTSQSGMINWDLLHNLASRSAVDQILVGRSIVEQYYGERPHHTYWNGCSTGGRQGYAIAQKYPDLVDGILAVAPAVSFVNVVMGALWPQAVMNTAKTYLSNCELEYFRAHAIQGCEATMDTRIGILREPFTCAWSPNKLVGSAFECDGIQVVVTDLMAQVIQRIHDGPAGKFPGLDWGVPMTTLANITTHHDGSRSPRPFRISASWLKHAVLQDQPYDITELDEESLNRHWVAALADFGGVMNTDDPDLSKLRDSKTKMLTWHGIDDEIIPYQNSLNYRKKVEGVMGGAAEVDEYFRLFLASGVTHCGGGIGPNPKEPLDALIRWVEENDPPDTLDAEGLDAEGHLVTRELCLWPSTARYIGIGDTNRASSWSCIGGTYKPAAHEPITEKEFDYGVMQHPQDGHVQRNVEEHGSGRTKQILGGLKDHIEGLGMGLRVN